MNLETPPGREQDALWRWKQRELMREFRTSAIRAISRTLYLNQYDLFDTMYFEQGGPVSSRKVVSFASPSRKSREDRS